VCRRLNPLPGEIGVTVPVVGVAVRMVVLQR
jgi:hypothetical protein